MVCSCVISKTSNRLIGVEIECVVPIIGTGEGQDVQRLLAQILTNQGILAVARGYTHAPIPQRYKLAIEYDVSLRDESKYAGLRWSKIEAKTMPMPFSELEQVLPAALEIIRYCGARVNHSCGLHVHHHLPEVTSRPETVRSLQRLWWRFHKVIYGLVPQSRLSNQYCRPPTRNDAQRFDGCNSFDAVCSNLQGLNRYNGLNLVNLAKPDRQTVEWRLHSGTTDWSKIRAWTLATQRWVEHAIARNCHFKPDPVANTRAGINTLLVSTGLKPNNRIYAKVDKDLRQVGKYLLRRWKHFNMPERSRSKAAA